MNNKKALLSTAILLALLGGCAQVPVTEGENIGDVPPSVDTKKAAESNADLGLRYMLQAKNELAMGKLKRALAYDAHSQNANHYIAELYRRVGKFAEADAHFRRAIDAESGDPNPQLHQNYGAFLCKQKRYEEAEKQFQKVLENPVYTGRTQVLENLGLCYKDKGEYPTAEGYLRQVLTAEPRSPRSLFGMAEVSFGQQNYTSARAFLQRYAEVSQPSPEVLWLGVRIERALGDKNAESSYGLKLKNWFPDSEQTREYLKSGNP